MTSAAQLDRATAGLPAPLVAVDLDALAASPAATCATLMVDEVAQAVRASRAAAAHGSTLRVCLDVDASLRLRHVCPTLFDGYRSFRPRPAAFVGLDVVRVPVPGYATVFGDVHLVRGDVLGRTVPTCRGEGRSVGRPGTGNLAR